MKQYQWSLKAFSKGSDLIQVTMVPRGTDSYRLSFRMPQESNYSFGQGPGIKSGNFFEGLWEDTCCEFFVAVENEDRYWEWNFAPNGNWACFAFCAPRQRIFNGTNKREIIEIALQDERCLEVILNLRSNELLNWAICTGKKLQINLSVVVKNADSNFEYFSLIHGEKADFHRRDLWTTVVL